VSGLKTAAHGFSLVFLPVLLLLHLAEEEHDEKSTLRMIR
jgi:hypothetical protein